MNEGEDPKRETRKMKLISVSGYFLVLALILVSIFVLYFMLKPDTYDEPIEHECEWRGGTFSKRILSPTSIEICFGLLRPEPKPTALEIILVRNGTDEGWYSFQSDDDGPLILAGGVTIGTIVYADSEDNERVNPGDKLDITGLHPASNYEIMLIWAPTGDVITRKTFTTPAG
jgi:hypothetical protein